ncbi:hypothetical protein HT746_05765 [Burkholderia pyrrocinia]|uniref:hypothetical protein n=1 Tax=Burkholderia pyrrocinia TaxID=60550 RepID=UPI0015777974|nr:hypothetical protein [Burkholderia pyrrocinia]NTX26650.1 hypothetical protein [Burkholderia pyrrocinia]QVN23403.1 hypothetical protein JYG32_33515 [Burkholderia pyrrocinia]
MHIDPVDDTLLSDSDRWVATTVAGAMDAARHLGQAGLGLGLVNLLLVATAAASAGPAAAGAGLIVSAVLMSQLWLGVRIAIDRRLFDGLALSCCMRDLKALDAALARLGWLRSEHGDRPLVPRARSAMRFLTWAGGLTILQLAATVLFLLYPLTQW